MILNLDPNVVSTSNGNAATGLIGYAPIASAYETVPVDDSAAVFDTLSASDGSDTSATLDTCLSSLQSTLPHYKSFLAEIDFLSGNVSTSAESLNVAQDTTRSLIQQESAFEENLGRLRQLYNQLAQRSNAIGDWMSEEKFVRDRIAVFYNGLTTLHKEQNEKLIAMDSVLDRALRVLAGVEGTAMGIMKRVANAQLAMRSWALNVTANVDTHTVKLDSVSLFFSRARDFAVSASFALMNPF